MSAATTTDRKTDLAVWLCILVLAFLVSFGFWGYSYDDNYITYRYAKSWLAGDGLVYNTGEKVFGTSAPGYALLLGCLAVLGRPFGIDVHHWGTVVALLSVLAVARVLEASTGPAWRRPLVAAFAAVALTLRLNLHLLGAEAFPVMALAVGSAFALFVRERPVAAGLLIAGALFLRLDAGLAALAIGLVEWRRRRRFPVAYAAAGLAPLAVWLLFLESYYGRIVPMTFEGKKALQEVPYTLREWQMLRAVLPLSGALALLGGALGGLAVLGRKGLWRRPLVVALGLWLLAHEAAYRALDVWFAPWYHVALVHALVALFAAGALAAARGAAGRWGPEAPGGRRAVAWALFALLAAPVVAPSLGFAAERWRRPPDPRHEIYAEAGRYIRDHVPPEAEVLALEIGVLGYLAERRILDYGALVSPPFTEAKFSRRRPQLVVELEPDYIVDIEHNTMLREAVDQPELAGRYVAVAVFRHADFAHGEVRLLERRGPERAAAGTGG